VGILSRRPFGIENQFGLMSTEPDASHAAILVWKGSKQAGADGRG
jgi:hypothetical protein